MVGGFFGEFGGELFEEGVVFGVLGLALEEGLNALVDEGVVKGFEGLGVVEGGGDGLGGFGVGGVVLEGLDVTGEGGAVFVALVDFGLDVGFEGVGEGELDEEVLTLFGEVEGGEDDADDQEDAGDVCHGGGFV